MQNMVEPNERHFERDASHHHAGVGESKRLRQEQLFQAA